MCGILGASGKVDAGIISALGCLNASRGTDSAGIAWKSGNKVKLKKQAGHPHLVFNTALAKEVIEGSRSGVIIGHTRQATHGACTSENAHPFLDSGIVFAHNGVIRNYQKFGNYEVDSQALIHGIKKRDFSEFEGNIALVWIEGGKLHCFRYNNPLFRGVLNGAIYLSSDGDHLKEVGCEKIRPLSEENVYVFENGSISAAKKVPVNKYKAATIVTGYQPGYHYESDHRPWWRDHQEADEAMPPRPAANAQCECGHDGSAHENRNMQNNWACFAKKDEGNAVSVLCPCNAWRKKEVAAPKAPIPGLVISKAPHHLCKCGHGFLRHTWRGNFNSCDLTSCVCANYKQAVEPLIGEAKKEREADLFNLGCENLPPETACECDHELEYHQGRDLNCAVASCTCNWFWPADPTIQDSITMGVKPQN